MRVDLLRTHSRVTTCLALLPKPLPQVLPRLHYPLAVTLHLQRSASALPLRMEEAVYASVGRNNREHVVFRYRRLKGVDWLTQRREIVGVPEGMSGGAVFAWTKAFPTSDVIELLKLVGILTEVADGRGLLVATKLVLFLHFILRNNPDLPIHPV